MDSLLTLPYQVTLLLLLSVSIKENDKRYIMKFYFGISVTIRIIVGDTQP